MKKHSYFILTALELLSFGGVWAVRYFFRRKLGMMRFVNHESRALEAALPMESLRLGCAAVLALLLLVTAILLLLRRVRLSRGALFISSAALLISAAVLYFLLTNSRETVSYFYFIAPLLLLASLLQLGKAALVLRKK